MERKIPVRIEQIPATRQTRRQRVAAYCRVSTEEEEQQTSYTGQQTYYKHKIAANPDWEFAGLYAEQQSGTRIKKRTAFRRMLRDALDGKIDIILCKSVSRWARNTVDGLRSLQLLTGNHIRVIFEEEHFDTATPGSLFQLNLAAAVAQNESEANSENQKWTYRKNARQGIRNIGSNHFFGYDGKNKTLIPNAEAPTVRFMYRSRIAGKSCREIADILNKKGKKTVRGNPFTGRAVRDILKNEVYKGDLRFQKQPSRNLITGMPDEIQVCQYVTGHHEPIVPPEIWNKAQKK